MHLHNFIIERIEPIDCMPLRVVQWLRNQSKINFRIGWCSLRVRTIS